MQANVYPDTPITRDRWILQHRRDRNILDPRRPYAFHVEEERDESGEVVPIATVFLTNRECPWRCLMCDLWKNTLTDPVPVGAVPEQIDYALNQLAATGARPRQIKLYNSGSFFDPLAIPPDDYRAIAERVKGFERVIVECHPALVNDRVLPFRDLLGTHFEIAMGLETVHPDILPQLNKRMTLEQFARASEFLLAHEIALRVFVLVKPPFLSESEACLWASRSVGFAFDCGATVVSLIPTRAGNGALEALAAVGDFSPPRLETFEAAVESGIWLHRGRVFGDLWDLQRFATCQSCLPKRQARLQRMNHRQVVEDSIHCTACARPRARPAH
jgi:radical SAM enzyme (TIGR01210 family)